MIESGLSDLIQHLKRYQFDVRETNPEESVSGLAGFIAVKDGVTINYDGTLYINNEPVKTPWGEFDLAISDHLQWFLENQSLLHRKQVVTHDDKGVGSI